MKQTDLAAQTKTAFSRLAKSICALTCERDGIRHMSAASAVCNISDTAPSLLVCLEKTASFSALLDGDSRFCVNVLSAAHRDIVTLCMTAKGEARFGAGQWHNDDGQPRLADAQASLLCTVAQRVDAGTHWVIIAAIDDVTVAGELSPLVYVGGELVSLP